MEAQKPARLDALTGLRCFAAMNIVLFHFSDPHWFGPLYPVVNAGYLSVSFFIMLSGFVLAYNYAGRARKGELNNVKFWTARFTRLYPVYLLSLLLGYQTLIGEYNAHTHTMFWLGIALTPLLLQGWVPEIATFWNTPAWTMSAEAAYYLIFPFIVLRRGVASPRMQMVRLALLWIAGMIPGILYYLYNPDHIAHVDRLSAAPWLNALKFTPIPHVASFLFGVLLAGLDEIMQRDSKLRLYLGLFGFASIYAVLLVDPPYAIIHDGLLMPLFGCLILGLAGVNPLSKTLSFRPFVFVGEASYCIYLMHFNFWNLLHDSKILERIGLSRLDPWLSYAIVIALGVTTLHLIEKPAQKVLRRWLAVTPPPEPAVARPNLNNP